MRRPMEWPRSQGDLDCARRRGRVDVRVNVLGVLGERFGDMVIG